MCTLGPHFKFCTCSDSSHLRDYWVLTTGNKEVDTGVVGSISMPSDLSEPEHFSNDSFFHARISFDLNNSQIFDFAYEPKEGDKIEVHFKEFEEDGLEMVWVYLNGEFQSLGMGVDYVEGTSLERGKVCFVPSPKKLQS